MTSKLSKKKKRVCVAMSGGVDSSVAAALLKEQGYDLVGLFMKLWTDKETSIENKCCSVDSYNDARKIAHQLGFKLYTLNFKKQFKKIVVNYFVDKYQSGVTPNPCVMCNKFIRFELLLNKAKMLNCDFLATGHYANIKKVGDQYQLFEGRDKNKDQSYFLNTLTQNKLKYLMFPLGNYTKPEVRKLAKKFNLPVYEKSESQEICFIPEKTHYPFLKRNLKLNSGPIKSTGGKTLGQHEGLQLYTLGQRKGIKIGGTGPYYVVKLDYQTNTLIVSSNRDDQTLLTKKFDLKDINWLKGSKPTTSEKFGVKIRYQAKTIPCTMKNNEVTLKIAERAIMPGQSAVFYKNEQLLGGGIIAKIKSTS